MAQAGVLSRGTPRRILEVRLPSKPYRCPRLPQAAKTLCANRREHSCGQRPRKIKSLVELENVSGIFRNVKQLYQMKTIVSSLLACISLSMFAQNGITFQVEKLSKPESNLFMIPSKDVYNWLILSDVNMYPNEGNGFPFNIVAKSQLPDSIVNFGYHSFFNGMYQAYADHRPFVLSPDMIWLLISQGFARHVSANPEKLRHYFVDFSGKLSLIVASDEIALDNPNSHWEKMFPEFTKQIAEHTGNEIINLLSSDFTTTTPIEKIASEITIMEAMKPYFEFIVIRVVCGIPEITLQGTPEDWQKILDKTKQLGKYDLEWWTEELEPILEEFVKASKGNINTEFWRNMFKYHSQEKYGAPNIIDGWIVKFFPYDKDGKRNNLKELEGRGGNLPEEIVKVDLKYIDSETGVTTPLEFWAGFIGLEQNTENFTLTPKISWMIRKKDIDNISLKQKLEAASKKTILNGGIAIRVKEFPKELLSLKEIESIEIQFLDAITIPDEFANVKVKCLRLSGRITEEGITRIVNMFPDCTCIVINGKFLKGQVPF